MAAPFISLLFPQKCSICADGVSDLSYGNVCEACWSRTCFIECGTPLCQKCGAFNSEINGNVRQTIRCGACETHSYDSAFALGHYDLGLRRAIISLKSTPHIPEIVARRIKGRFQSLTEIDFDLIVPVPLSKQRRFERGFNQAETIAEVVAKATGKPVDRLTLHRQKHTKMHRAGMDQKAREKTVENAFAVVRPNIIAGKNVLLTDDVFTSGATASACSASLKSRGALRVTVFTIARADSRRS